MQEAFGTAARILFRWTSHGAWPEHRDRRLSQILDPDRWRVSQDHPLISLANYPETVALAGLLAEAAPAVRPIWRDEVSLEQFCAEVSRRLRIRYQPSDSRDPLIKFLDQQRRDVQDLVSLHIGP